jgi:hypothetical protein
VHPGKNSTLTGAWRWADQNECDPDTYAFNPWHCHFISITGCNTPELRDAVPFQDNWMYPQKERYEDFYKREFFKAVEDIKSFREKYGDAPRLGNEWIDSRLLAYVVRPSITMRFRLRRTMATSLVFLKPGEDIAPIFDPMNVGASWSHSHSHVSAHHALEPRLGMHVRNGDSMNDQRHESKIDHSFRQHMICAEQFAMKLGVRNIYLATDNVTLFELAPQQYPQYGWMAQQRRLKTFDGHSFVGYFNEKSVHQDVANMLVGNIKP